MDEQNLPTDGFSSAKTTDERQIGTLGGSNQSNSRLRIASTYSVVISSERSLCWEVDAHKAWATFANFGRPS
jgi:hypothetical protein